MLRLFATLLLSLTFAGCASVAPPSRAALVGDYSVEPARYFGGSLHLQPDGTYERFVTEWNIEATVISDADGQGLTYKGRVNEESGTWSIVGASVVLAPLSKEIENPDVEAEYFDHVRSFPLRYEGGAWVLHYPDKKFSPMTRHRDTTPPAAPHSVAN